MEEKYQQVCEQIEFYFSDGNLRHDTFLKNKLLEDNGWVSVTTILTFNRIKKACLSEEDLAQCIKKSSQLKLNEDGSKIKRKKDFIIDDFDENQIIASSLFVDGFSSNASLEDCRNVFLNVIELKDIIYIKMRKRGTNFLGSIFIEFSNENIAKKVLDVQNLLLINGKPLKEVTPMEVFAQKVLSACEEQ